MSTLIRSELRFCLLLLPQMVTEFSGREFVSYFFLCLVSNLDDNSYDDDDDVDEL